MKGLIIDEPWIGLILSGDKTWEMRKTTCHYRGPIALIRKGSGRIVGTAEIVDSLSSIESASDYARAEPWHRIPPSRQAEAFSDGWRTPWVLRNAQHLDHPIAYKHPNGAVIWVNLDDNVRGAVAAQSGESCEQQAPLIVCPANEQADDSLETSSVHAERWDAIESPRSNNNGRAALHSVVRRGKAAGTVLSPHVHADGCYVASPSRYERDYIRLRSIDEVKEYLRRGYSLRMSNQEEANHRAPSLIAPGSIVGWG